MKVEGIFPPIITPFDEAGAVDERRLGRLVEFWAPYVHGLFVCGTYGSGPLLTAEERRRVLEAVTQLSGGRLPIIAQVGAVDTATSVSLAQHAEACGACAVAALPPFYYAYDGQALREYFRALIEAVSIPVYAYDNPKTTGNPLSPALLNELADMGLAGLKDSSFDIGKLYLAMRTVTRPGFDFVIGSESLMLPAFAMGVRGCVAGLANAFPDVMRRFFDAATAGTPLQMQEWQMRVLKLWDVLHLGPSVPTTYAILRMRGIDAGFPRRPMLPLNPETLSLVQRQLASLQYLLS